jgi:hypothetical protein
VLYHLDGPAQLPLDPVLAAAGVALIDPDVLQARERRLDLLEQQRHAGPISEGGAVDLCPQDQPLRVDQEVPLATAELFGAVVAALAPDAGRLDRLAVDDPGARLRGPAGSLAEPLAQGGVETLPGPIQPPQTKGVVDGLPGGNSWGSSRQAQPPRMAWKIASRISRRG